MNNKKIPNYLNRKQGVQGNTSTNSISMTKSQKDESQSRANNSSKNIQSLMHSIQSKLSMLANDSFDRSKLADSYTHNQHQNQFLNNGQIEMKQKAYLDQERTAQRDRKLHLRQLETSFQQKSSKKNSEIKQSRVLNRINQMEDYYMKQIKQLNYKIVFLQNENEELKEKNRILQVKNDQYYGLVHQNERQFKNQLNRQMDKIKQSLINKFSREAQSEYEKHFIDLKQIKQELSRQKKKRKQAEDQLDILRAQKQTLQEFYRELLENHKKFLQVDINQSQNNLGSYIQSDAKTDVVVNKKRYQQSAILSSSSHKNKSVKSQIRRKTKKKNFSKDQIKVLESPDRQQEEVNRDQLIPILAKGIQQLKNKLNMK